MPSKARLTLFAVSILALTGILGVPRATAADAWSDAERRTADRSGALERSSAQR